MDEGTWDPVLETTIFEQLRKIDSVSNYPTIISTFILIGHLNYNLAKHYSIWQIHRLIYISDAN